MRDFHERLYYETLQEDTLLHFTGDTVRSQHLLIEDFYIEYIGYCYNKTGDKMARGRKTFSAVIVF